MSPPHADSNNPVAAIENRFNILCFPERLPEPAFIVVSDDQPVVAVVADEPLQR